MSIARRPLLDIPIAVNGGSGMAANSSGQVTQPGSPTSAAAAPDTDSMRIRSGVDPAPVDPDFDLSTTFDVPAFLRRQEG
jgi:hypothetical protein